MKLIIECQIDDYNLPVIEKISTALFVAPIDKITKIEELVDDDKYEEAEELLDEIEKEYDQSVFTIRFRTRISRIRLLGKINHGKENGEYDV